MNSLLTDKETTYETAPIPKNRTLGWIATLLCRAGRASHHRWGAQLLRVASDMIVICDESLVVQHHNRAFLKAVGYTSGSFKGNNLVDFFPKADRGSIIDVFDQWKKGHAAGMRFQCTLLTRQDPSFRDFRVVRSRSLSGRFFYYMIGREVTDPGVKESEAERRGDPFFRGLPVAAWRTDAALRITQAYGSLWPELGIASEDLIGEEFGRRHDSLLPPLLREIDCSDTLSGMSTLSEIQKDHESYSASVEPILNSDGQVIGTVGLLRRSARIASAHDRTRGIPQRSAPHHVQPGYGSGEISIVTARVPTFVDNR